MIATKKYLLPVLGGVLLFLLIAYAGVYMYVRMQLQSELQNEFAEFWNKHYACDAVLSIEGFRLSPIFNTVDVRGLKISSPDIHACGVDAKLGFLPLLSIDQVRIELFSFRDLLNQKKSISVRLVKFESFNLDIYQVENTERLADEGENADEEIEKNILEAFIIERIQLKNFSLNIYDLNHPDERIAQLKDLNVDISPEFHHKGDEIKNLDINLVANDIYFQKSGSLYAFQLGQIKIVDNGNLLKLYAFKALPIIDKIEYSSKLEYQDDFIQLSFDSLLIHSFAFEQLFKHQEIICNHAALHELHVEVYRDKNVPFDDNQRPEMPIQLLQLLNVGLHLDSLTLSNAFIKYEELAEGREVPGEITFNQLNATFFNVSNHIELRSSDELIIKASAYVFNEIPLNAVFRYALVDTTGKFSVEGLAGAGNFPVINQMLEPLSGIKIEDGKHEKTYFFIEGDNHVAQGKVEMYYEELMFEISSEMMDGFVYFKRVLARLGNRFLINSSNPGRRGEFITGEVYFERDVTKFVFNYWWHSFFTGIRSTMVAVNPTLREFFPKYDFDQFDNPQ